MRLRLRQFRPRTGSHEHRVVLPRQPLRRTSLRAPKPIGLLLGDHDGLNRLACLFSFAAYSRHTIVHVPLRDGLPPDEGVGCWMSGWQWLHARSPVASRRRASSRSTGRRRWPAM